MTEIMRSVLAGHKASVVGLAFSADGQRLATAGGDDGTVRIWDLASGKELFTLNCVEDGTVSRVAFSPDGKTVLAGRTDHDCGVHVWDAQTGKEIVYRIGRPTYALAFAPDGATFAVGGDDGVPLLYDTATWKVSRSFEQQGGNVTALAFSPDGQILASGDDGGVRIEGEGGGVRLWDVARGKLRISPPPQQSAVVGLAFAPDGKSLFIGLRRKGPAVRLWDLTTRKEVETFRAPEIGEGKREVARHLALSPDGKTLAVAIRSGEIRLLNAATGALQVKLRAHHGFLNCVAFAPDGKKLASGSHDCTVKLWDLTRLPT